MKLVICRKVLSQSHDKNLDTQFPIVVYIHFED